MKAKKLVSIALPVMMLLSGCGSENKTSKETKTEVKEKDIQKVKVSEEDYPIYLSNLGDEYSKAIQMSDETTNAYFDKKKSKQDVIDSIEKVEGVLIKFEEIEPPSKYVDLQKNVEKAIGKYKKAISLLKDIRKGNKPSSKDSSKQIEKLMTEGDEYWIAVYKEVRNEVTKSSGGSLKQEDLENTNTGAGVDYESVKKNVVDGSELIANWGMVRNGNFIPMFILKGGEPKTFEIYTNDEYPSKANILEGTWGYDKENMLLKIHFTKQYSNGVVVEITRKDEEYKLQNYDSTHLQVYNESARTTSRYIKQK
ncbi:DUF3994 domain-containing protein [Bacillus cereus group sp. BfR-BA-01380]|uniref:DUF3994 domain-containing protein n=1 Tax=Bacillus cereus group sp. BfR-BA-01380 TaxID=2920324 RepID=UPI001F59C2BB|nr:DUF3994 domain-containing protein [Bacillus cereus group sp. BfR-BA-01380]